MTNPLKNLIKNTTIIYSTEILIRFFLLIAVIYTARVLGVKLFGDFSYAYTLFIFLLTFSDFGFITFLTREVAQENEKRDKIFHTALYLRTTITSILLVVFMLYLYVSEARPDIFLFVLITGLSLVFSSYALNFVLTLRGLNMMKMDSLTRGTGMFIITVCIILSLKAGLGLLGIACAIAVGNISTVGISLWINKKYGIIQRPESKKFEYVDMVKRSLPFGIMAILVTVYTRVDTLLLQHIKGAIEVGLYHASFKVVEAILILPYSVSIVLLPVLSSFLHKEDIDTTKKTVQLVIKYMAYGGIFGTVITFMMSDKIIEVLYFSPEYKDAVLGMQILSFIITVIFIASVAGSLILSSKIAYINVWINLTMVVLSVAMNLTLIPKLGFAGASLVRLVTEVFGLTLNMFFVNKRLFRINYFADIKKPLFAGIILSGFVLIAKSLLFLPVYLLIYLAILYTLGGISTRELAFIKELVMERVKKS